MNNAEQKFYDEYLPKIRLYSKPTEAQKLIIQLSDIENRNKEEEKQLTILINAERQAQKLKEAKQAANNLLNEQKKKARQEETRKKIIWGAALKTASKKNLDIAKVMKYLYAQGFVADKDKEVVKDDYDNININN